jgi:hypothetical protein
MSIAVLRDAKLLRFSPVSTAVSEDVKLLSDEYSCSFRI